MAVQFNVEELDGCEKYFNWLCRMAGYPDPDEVARRGDGETPTQRRAAQIAQVAILVLRVMFGTDFSWIETDEKIADDGNRAADGMAVRRVYADEAGRIARKSGRDIDRIWKSIHGKASVLEVILSLCIRLDEMLNEDEPGIMVSRFFRILMSNLKVTDLTKELKGGWTKEEIRKLVEGRIQVFLDRKYEENGAKGGLFPLKNNEILAGKDLRKEPLWVQMNLWVDENSDEDGYFCG